MSLQYKTKAFVFKRKDRGEADRIFTVFAYDFGKIDIFARSIRKIDSKLKSGIDIFCFSEIEFVQGKKKILTDASIINKFSYIINNPDKFNVAQKIAKVLDVFIHDQEYDHKIFDLILETFERLNDSFLHRHYEELQLLFIYFLWNFFAVLGYSPQLSNCAHCHSKLNENELYFSNNDGGVICNFCFAGQKNQPSHKSTASKVSSDIVKIMRIIIKKDWSTIQKLKLQKTNLKILNDITKNYYLYLISTISYGN